MSRKPWHLEPESPCSRCGRTPTLRVRSYGPALSYLSYECRGCGMATDPLNVAEAEAAEEWRQINQHITNKNT